jgi:(S)-2-hydroxyglutarate dehydrogenase
LVPGVQEVDLLPSPAGVRAQALLPCGQLVDDFLLVKGTQSMHVLNAPSPAATASLAIGDFIATQLPELRSSRVIAGCEPARTVGA